MGWLVGEDFEALFDTFEHTAFRLEVRDSYRGINYEMEPFRKFLAGEPDDMAWMQDWYDYVAGLTAAGKWMSRVRVVTEPHTDFVRFMLRNCLGNVRAGEDIGYLARDTAAGLPDYDFWLFDSRALYILHFDDNNDLLGAEPVDDPARVVQHNFWRDAARHAATPYFKYIDEDRVDHSPPSP